MDNYKGLYYKESKEQRYYEGGAHFSYEELYEVLLYLKEEQDKKNMSIEQKNIFVQNQNNKNSILMSGINSNICVYDLLQNNNNNNKNKNKQRTRNVGNSAFYNNPNTKIKNNLNKSNNQHLSIGLSYNEKKHPINSRNYNNDFNLFYNRTSNHINNDTNYFQDTNI